MASISSTGLGSGLDVNGLVAQLVAAEGKPVQVRLDRQEALLQAKLSAVGSLKGSLSGFQSALASLKTVDRFTRRSAGVSDATVLGATASASAAAGSYAVEVTQLAQSHRLASGAYATTTEAIGTGTLTFRFGTTVYDPDTDAYTSFAPNADRSVATVTIDAGSSSLSGIRDAINAAGIGVAASIVHDGSGYRLVLSSSDPGAANSLEIVTTGDLSAFEFNSSATNLTQTAAARDAIVKIDGLTVTRASNTVSDAIAGVTLDLKKTNGGTPVTLTVAHDKGAVKGAVDDFVKAYNGFVKTLNKLTSYDAETRQAGALLGDGMVRNIASRLRQRIGQAIPGLAGPMRALADIGVKTDSVTGTLSVDGAKLDGALGANFDDVVALFASLGKPSDALVAYSGSTADTRAGDYALELTAVATQGRFTGAVTAGFPLTISADNDAFVVRIDGVISGTIALTRQSYASGAALAAELQSRINGDSALKAAGVKVAVDYDTDRFVIRSARYGADSKVEILSVDATTSATLGLSVGAGTAGVDVAGTIGGIAATGVGRFLTGAGDAAGLKIEVLGGTTGARGSVRFTRGIADELDVLVGNLLGAGGDLSTRMEGIGEQIEQIGDQREALNRRLAALEARYRAQFTALDSLLSQLRKTSDFLAQQLAVLPKSG